MADRRAPVGGYDFGQKRHYRRRIWAEFRRAFSGSMASRVFALLPSSEGTEIDVALQAGARERNLILIDENPAIVATLKRRYPRVRTYGVDAARAIERIAKDVGQIDGMNLDLCGPAAAPLFHVLKTIAKTKVIRDRGRVAVTMLRGRDRDISRQVLVKRISEADSPAKRMGDQLSPRDRIRVGSASNALAGFSKDERLCGADLLRAPYLWQIPACGTYASPMAKQTFLWAIFRAHEMPCLCGSCLEYVYQVVGDTSWPFDEFVDLHRSHLVRYWGEDRVNAHYARLRNSPVYARGVKLATRREMVNA